MTDSPRELPTRLPHADALRAEASYLHRCLFSFPVSERIVERYVQAHGALELATDVDVARIVERQLDAEALEFLARRRSPSNSLTQKLRVLLYLAEIEPDYYDAFARDRGTFWSAIPTLACAPFRTAYKLLRGKWQSWRHDVL